MQSDIKVIEKEALGRRKKIQSKKDQWPRNYTAELKRKRKAYPPGDERGDLSKETIEKYKLNGISYNFKSKPKRKKR